MIQWRTSRFLLMFFILHLVIVGVSVVAVIERRGAAVGRNSIIAPRPRDGIGHSLQLPDYPPVQVVPPAASIFE